MQNVNLYNKGKVDSLMAESGGMDLTIISDPTLLDGVETSLAIAEDDYIEVITAGLEDWYKISDDIYTQHFDSPAQLVPMQNPIFDLNSLDLDLDINSRFIMINLTNASQDFWIMQLARIDGYPFMVLAIPNWLAGTQTLYVYSLEDVTIDIGMSVEIPRGWSVTDNPNEPEFTPVPDISILGAFNLVDAEAILPTGATMSVDFISGFFTAEQTITTKGGFFINRGQGLERLSGGNISRRALYYGKDYNINVSGRTHDIFVPAQQGTTSFGFWSSLSPNQSTNWNSMNWGNPWISMSSWPSPASFVNLDTSNVQLSIQSGAWQTLNADIATLNPDGSISIEFNGFVANGSTWNMELEIPGISNGQFRQGWNMAITNIGGITASLGSVSLTFNWNGGIETQPLGTDIAISFNRDFSATDDVVASLIGSQVIAGGYGSYGYDPDSIMRFQLHLRININSPAMIEGSDLTIWQGGWPNSGQWYQAMQLWEGNTFHFIIPQNSNLGSFYAEDLLGLDDIQLQGATLTEVV